MAVISKTRDELVLRVYAVGKTRIDAFNSDLYPDHRSAAWAAVEANKVGTSNEYDVFSEVIRIPLVEKEMATA